MENLVLACWARGLRPRVHLLLDGPESDRVALVAFTAGAARPSPLYEAIGRRHTNRGPYDGRPVPTKTLTGLVDTINLFAALAWTAIVPVLLLLTTAAVAAPLIHAGTRTR